LVQSAPLPAWRRAGESLLALALVRAEFASVELTIAAQAGLRWLLVALASCVIAMLGLIALSATLVIALWERLGWYSLAALAFLYCATTVLLVAWLLRSLAAARPLLSDTLAEIAKDGAAIRSSAAVRPADEHDDGG
jgi:uncharacterized membrane protein YqjE